MTEPGLADLLSPREPEELLEQFAAWAAQGGRPLYQAQEDELLELAEEAPDQVEAILSMMIDADEEIFVDDMTDEQE